MKKLFSLLLSAALLSGLLVTGAAAATLQSNQAVYQLSQDPLGTEPFSYSATETHSATLVPVGTAIQSEGDGLLLVEVFLYHEAEKHWSLDSMLSGQSQLTIRDGDHIYHISTMDPSSSEPNAVLDRGIWVKGQSTSEVQPVTITGEPVDDWAANLVNEAIAKDLFPSHLKGQDLREPITRTQFAALSVRLYEAMSGQTVPAFTGTNPFTDTTDSEVLKAYSMGFTSGVSSTSFGAGTQLNREQAAPCSPPSTGSWAGPSRLRRPPPSLTAAPSPPGPETACASRPPRASSPAMRTAASVRRTPPSGRPASLWPCGCSRSWAAAPPSERHRRIFTTQGLRITPEPLLCSDDRLSGTPPRSGPHGSPPAEGQTGRQRPPSPPPPAC